MKPRQTSFAFLMEMLWVSGFFILSACIFLLVFIKADQMSLHASNLNQAVLNTENAVEDIYASYHPEEFGNAEHTLYYDKNWDLVDGQQPEAAFFITVKVDYNDDMLNVSAQAFELDRESIYTLDGARYLPID